MKSCLFFYFLNFKYLKSIFILHLLDFTIQVKYGALLGI